MSLKKYQECKDKIDNHLNEKLTLYREGKSLRQNIQTQIEQHLIEETLITDSTLNEVQRKVKEFSINQPATTILPQEKGAYYDLTEYNDSGTDTYPYVFCKTLNHSPNGFATKADIDKLITAINFNSLETLQAIPKDASSLRKLEGVPVSNASNNEAKQPHCVTLNGAYDISSGKSLFEMMEVYCKQLVRDIPFHEWSSDSTVANLITYLNNYGSDITGPTESNVININTFLRGSGIDETKGPYISQFLLRDFYYGNHHITQVYHPENNANTQIIDSHWLNVQRGITVYSNTYLDPTPKGVFKPRVLASIVHNDPLYQFYYNAALILNGLGVQTVGYDNSSINSSVWTDGGPPSVISMLAEVGSTALHVAWYQKYGLTLKIRPEVLAQRLLLAYTDTDLRTNVPKLNDIKTQADKGAQILALVDADNMSNGGQNYSGFNYYLNVLFPEGSPTHPSFPAGHAVVAGAMVTVLKATVVTHDNEGARLPWTFDVYEATTNSNTEAYTGDASGMTIIGELNKLASNVALGRDFAGVHYRSDGDKGILSGEEIAISFLQNKIKEFGVNDSGLFTGWDLEKMDGTRILIKKDSISTL